MKTKFKDLLLYSLATIGVVALFISATQPQESHGTPESHIWEMHSIGDANSYMTYSFNKVTGEVRKHNTGSLSIDNNGNVEDISDNKYSVMIEAK